MNSVYIFLGLVALFFVGLVIYIAISWPKWTSKQRKYSVSGIVGLITIVFVIGFFTNSMSMAYARPTELLDQIKSGEIKLGDQVKVEGEIIKGTIKKFDYGSTTEFEIKDKDSKIKVRFEGVLPDNFKAGIHAIAVGTYDGKIFSTTDVKTRCPSKYEAAAEKEKEGAK